MFVNLSDHKRHALIHWARSGSRQSSLVRRSCWEGAARRRRGTDRGVEGADPLFLPAPRGTLEERTVSLRNGGKLWQTSPPRSATLRCGRDRRTVRPVPGSRGWPVGLCGAGGSVPHRRGLSGPSGRRHWGEETDTEGGFSTVLRQPFGKFLLGVLALGLLGYSVWRFVQAIKDPEHGPRPG